MIVMWGTRLYGKVDHVPGLFYVATNFAYLQFIPLFPTTSYVIIDGSEGSQGFRGVSIPMNGKSVLIAYLRAALFLAVLFLVGCGIASVAKDPMLGGVLIAAGVLCGIAFPLSYRLTRPSPERALRLANEAGIEPEVVARHFVGARMLKDSDDSPRDALPADDEADYRARRNV